MKPEGATYEQSGVSLDRADSFLDAMLRWLRRTEEIPGDVRSLVRGGWYASVLDCGLPVALALTADGVGSKILVAEEARDWSRIGIDLIAMNVNDLLCVGARPLALLDYLAIQDPPAEVGEQLGRGLLEGARQAEITIPGGELAQLPEMIRGVRENEGIDLAGTAIGLVAKEGVSDGSGLAAGDVLLGVASDGLHSNGYTLVREVLLKRARMPLDAQVPELGCTLAEELLRPTRIYVKSMQSLGELRPKALFHITGGGFLNLLRAATDDVTFVVDAPPAIPPVFALLQERGKIADEEMHRVFNMGVGLVLAVAAEKADATLAALGKAGETARRIGKIESGKGRSVTLPTRGLVSDGNRFRQG